MTGMGDGDMLVVEIKSGYMGVVNGGPLFSNYDYFPFFVNASILNLPSSKSITVHCV